MGGLGMVGTCAGQAGRPHDSPRAFSTVRLVGYAHWMQHRFCESASHDGEVVRLCLSVLDVLSNKMSAESRGGTIWLGVES